MRILLGIDLRIHGHEWLIEQAARFAEMIEGQIHFLFAASTRASDSDLDGYRERLARMLERVPEGQRGSPLVERGSPAETLIQSTRRCDLLVVGPRDPGAIEKMLLGPMATRVIHRAECPVLIPRTEVRPITRAILGVHPYNGFGENLVNAAGVWMQRLDCKLDGAYVEPGHLPYIPDAGVRARAEKELLASREPDREAVAALLRALPEAARGEARIAIGDPGEKIAQMSEDYDLALCGTMERTGLKRYVLGSVAAHIVRNARCPVLTLPTPHATS